MPIDSPDRVTRIKPLFVRSRSKILRRGHFNVSTRYIRQKHAVARNYLRLYNSHVAEVNAEDQTPSLNNDRRAPALLGSVVNGVDWSAAEKEKLFRALSRRGKSAVTLISSDVGTKSVLEVAGYLHTLQDAYTSLRTQAAQSRASSDVFGLIPYAALPIAVEVTDVFLRVEKEQSGRLCEYVNSQYHAIESSKLGWSVIDESTASLIDSEVNLIDDQQSDLFYRASPELITLRSDLMLRLARAFSSSDTTSKVIYRETMTQLYSLIVNLARRLVSTSQIIAKTRFRVEDKPYFDVKRFKGRNEISKLDIWSACALLKIPPNSEDYWNALATSISNDEQDSDPMALGSDTTDQSSDNGITVAPVEEGPHGRSVSEIVDDNHDESRMTLLDTIDDAMQESDTGETEPEEILDALLDQHDAFQSGHEECLLRSIVGLAIPPTTPNGLSPESWRMLDKYGWSEEYSDIVPI